MTDNKAHQRIRTHLLPVYQGRGLPDQEAIVDAQVARFVRMVEERYLSTRGVGGGLRPFEMGRKFMYFTQDAISAVEFGEPFGYMEADDDFQGVIGAMENMMMPCAIMSLLPAVLWLVTSPVGKLFLPRKTDKSGVGRLLGVIGERVGERYAEKGERKNDVLQGIVESGLSREEVESEALVHILGGTDTTAAALRNAVFFLSTSPTAYRRLQDEIDAAVGRVSRPVIADAECKELSFLQVCIREPMRMWPPISGIQAKASDTDVVICGVKVPAGTHIAMGWFEIMRDKAVFGADAEVFEPMRWLEAEPERLKEMEAIQGLTFSLGTRWECLGKRLANMEMSKVLFEVSAAFSISTPDSDIVPTDWHSSFSASTLP
jgi:cytochrome P450